MKLCLFSMHSNLVGADVSHKAMSFLVGSWKAVVVNAGTDVLMSVSQRSKTHRRRELPEGSMHAERPFRTVAFQGFSLFCRV